MIRVPSIAVPLDTQENEWPIYAAKLLKIAPDKVRSVRLVKRSVDARRKDDVHFVLTLDVAVDGDEQAVLTRSGHRQASIVEDATKGYLSLYVGNIFDGKRPIVVGSGPAGLFAALTLAQAGAMPVMLERGREAQRRRNDVEAFWDGGPLDTTSNVQFGEGGAGTFSDGKLNTGTKDPRIRAVLDTFVRCGAPEEILWQAKPHIGTDHLVRVVQAMREEIISLGGEVLFEHQLTGLHIEQGQLQGIHVGDREIETNAALLCIGHSARDTFEMLHGCGIHMEAKPFSIGVRIEHPQTWLDRAQYGRFAGHPALGAADYKLSTRLSNGRGVYTFCMCPGGVVVAAASEQDGVVTNGMSYFARDGKNANSALLVDVRPEDYGGQDEPLAGIHFQRNWEQKAFALAGGTYAAPAQRAADLMQGRATKALDGLLTTYRPGVLATDLRECLPGFVTEAIAEALPLLDRQLHGFASHEAILTGVETRSSSPVRILRDPQGHASIKGIFPAGEGAGYAGGIMSAAVDGIRSAEAAMAWMRSLD